MLELVYQMACRPDGLFEFTQLYYLLFAWLVEFYIKEMAHYK